MILEAHKMGELAHQGHTSGRTRGDHTADTKGEKGPTPHLTIDFFVFLFRYDRLLDTPYFKTFTVQNTVTNTQKKSE